MTRLLPEKRIRPAANGADSKSLADGDNFSIDQTSTEIEESILMEVRRRKAFARRLPPLADGRRDPWLSVRPENASEVA